MKSWVIAAPTIRRQFGRLAWAAIARSSAAASAAGDRPDRIPVAADKPSYKPGETAHISIKPASDGQALVVVAGDRDVP